MLPRFKIDPSRRIGLRNTTTAARHSVRDAQAPAAAGDSDMSNGCDKKTLPLDFRLCFVEGAKRAVLGPPFEFLNYFPLIQIPLFFGSNIQKSRIVKRQGPAISIYIHIYESLLQFHPVSLAPVVAHTASMH